MTTPDELAELFATTLQQALDDPGGAPPPENDWRALGQRAAELQRFYLDKNVWIWLRDVQLGRTRNAEHERLYDGLAALVDRGTHVCPASDVLFFELITQRDRATRIATAEVIDRLCGGLALAPYDRRREVEFFRWLMVHLAPGFTFGDALPAVWLPVFHLLGPMVPHDESLPHETNKAIQHAWLTTSSQISMASLIEILPEPPELEVGSQAFADQMSAGKDAHAHEADGYEALFKSELEGGVESSGDSLSSALRMAAKVLRGIDGGPIRPEIIRQYARLIVAVYEAGKLGDDLPTLQVAAAYHATIRADPPRRYKKGDWMDSLHAAAAVPYCTVLLTEASLRHLLTTRPADLASRFKCEVRSDPAEMVALVDGQLRAS